MTPADRALAEAIRAVPPSRGPRVSVSGIDGSGKSTLCAALADAVGWTVVRVPDRERVAALRAAGCSPGLAQVRALQQQRLGWPCCRILDRGPLCIAAIHPEMWALAVEMAEPMDLTILLDLPLSEARARKADPEAEQRDRDTEARRYRELAARWPRTVILDASQPPEAVLSAALRAVARAVGVGL